MKIRIVFIEPPYKVLSAAQILNPSERFIFIKDPYNITTLEGGRSITSLNGTHITYEQYCIQLQDIIDDAIRSLRLEKINRCDSIVIESCKEPPNFAALMTVLADIKLSTTSNCHLLFKDCSFSGTLYVNSVINFVRSCRRRKQEVHFTITLDQENLKPSEHDQAKMGMLNDVTFFPDTENIPTIRRFTDDQFINEKKTGLYITQSKQTAKYDDDLNKKRYFFRLANPTYFFRSQMGNKFSPRNLLMNFFSQVHQQRSDYTCGPAALKMVADYYLSLTHHPFCGKPIANHHVTIQKSNGKIISAGVWNVLNSYTEFELAERVKTTEEVGSDIADMREGLLNLGLQVIDDSEGINCDEHNESTVQAHKKILWYKIQEVLNLGVPVIINMQDKFEVGHYEVAIGIDSNQNIILAEPGTALVGKVEFESIAKEKFIARWKNMNGKFHGRFLIVIPNDATAQTIELIFNDTPHYYNGKSINRNISGDQSKLSS